MANQIKLPATASTRAVQKMTIPWDDGSGNNLYLNFDPEFVGTQDVIITSDENPKDESRTKNLVFKTSTPGLSSGQQSQATLEIVQTPSVITYELQLQDVTGSGSIDDTNESQVNIPAGGGLVSLVFRVAKYINGKFDSYYQSNITRGIIHSDTSAYNWVKFERGNEFSVDSRGITEGVVRSTGAIQYTWNNGDKLNPIQVSMSVIVQQEANVKTITALSILNSGTLQDVPASGVTSYDPTKYWAGYTIGVTYSYTSGVTWEGAGGLNTDEWRLIYTQAPPTSIASLGATPKARSRVDNFEWRVQAIGNTSIQSEKLTMDIYQEANYVSKVGSFYILQTLLPYLFKVCNKTGIDYGDPTYFSLEEGDDFNNTWNAMILLPASGGYAEVIPPSTFLGNSMPVEGWGIRDITMTSGSTISKLTNLDLKNEPDYQVKMVPGSIQNFNTLNVDSLGSTVKDQSLAAGQGEEEKAFSMYTLNIQNKVTDETLTSKDCLFAQFQEANHIVKLPSTGFAVAIDPSYIRDGGADGSNSTINANCLNTIQIPPGSVLTSGSTLGAVYGDVELGMLVNKYGLELYGEFGGGQPSYEFAGLNNNPTRFNFGQLTSNVGNLYVDFVKGFSNLGTVETPRTSYDTLVVTMKATNPHTGEEDVKTGTPIKLYQAANVKYENKVMFVPLEGAVPSTINDLTKMMDSGNYVPSSGLLSYQVPHISGSQLEEYFAIWKFTAYTSKAYSNASQGYSQGTELEGYDIGELAGGGLAMCDWQDATYEIDDPNEYGYVKFIWYSGDKTTVSVNITNRGGAEGIFRYTINNL